jgi:hypothetical protein
MPDFGQNTMIWAVAGGLGVVGLLMFLGGLGGLFRGRPFSGLFGGLSGAALAALGAATGLTGLNLQTYSRLSYERPVAEVTIERLASNTYIANVKTPDGQVGRYDLRGDAWQMDARVLKWKPWANIVGLDAQYRLDRISGRYNDISAERSQERTVHQLSENPGLDIWTLVQTYGAQARAVDAIYGSGTFVPLADGAVYEVSITQDALVARPANDAARLAVQNWR